MTEAVLPAILRPSQPATLVRIGKDNDGGYLVDRRDIDVSDCLIGLGINVDWSFERVFCRQRPVRLIALDGSIALSSFARSAGRALLRPWRTRELLYSVLMLYHYLAFFRGPRRHIAKHVGAASAEHQVAIRDVLAMATRLGARKPFLKIDIEGSEYDVLEELINHSGLTTGLVIEFHDCHARMESICDFVRRYGLKLVHVHANNYAPVDAQQVPLVIECTFSSSPGGDGRLSTPHPLDMPNNPQAEEITVTFLPESRGLAAP